MPNLSNVPAWMWLVFLLLAMLIAGAAEYLHIAPANTFYTVFLLAMGIATPSPLFGHPAAAQVVTPSAVVDVNVPKGQTNG